jgi:hypothetical protein
MRKRMNGNREEKLKHEMNEFLLLHLCLKNHLLEREAGGREFMATHFMSKRSGE